MSDYIKREDAIKAVNKAKAEGLTECPTYYLGIVPSADVVPKDFHDKTCEAMAQRHAEEIQRLMPKRGEWEEKETFSVADNDPIIERWQSARCSMCERYHTTPYMYYFNNYNFCPYCGADMREREGE